MLFEIEVLTWLFLSLLAVHDGLFCRVVSHKGFAISMTSDSIPRNSKRRIRVRLDTVADARREVAKLYRMAREGEIEISDASKLANILALIARMVEGSDLEARLEALEAR